MSNSDGSCAFPCHRDVNPDGNQSGMSLRDYFATAAMQGWMATYGEHNLHPADTEHPNAPKRDDMLAHIAGDAYAIADAMLAERQKAVAP